MALAMMAAGCATSGGGTTKADAGTELRAASVTRADASGADVTPAVRGLTAFAADLYHAVGASDENVVVSPLSVAVAMSMARVGARGATAAEIDRVLHYPSDGRDAAFNALTRALVTTDTAPPRPSATPTAGPGSPPAPPVVAIANGLFLQSGLQVHDAFLRTLAADYGAGARAVDFRSADAAGEINEWVRAHTADRIRRLFDSLDPSTRLVLANAVYLKADWLTPFVARPASEEVFTRADGGTEQVPMMHLDARVRYVRTADWQAVELPYAGDRLAMWVIVPGTGTALGKLLTEPTLQRVASGLHPTRVALSMPRWDFATDLDLSAVLARMGLHRPFSPSADFSGIAPGLFISQAVHRANITVDEWGTEAAAVTGIAMAVAARPPASTVVRADHPFAFAVVDRTTSAPLFVGSVADPAAR